jgi:hypothetical protein
LNSIALKTWLTPNSIFGRQARWHEITGVALRQCKSVIVIHQNWSWLSDTLLLAFDPYSHTKDPEILVYLSSLLS